MDELIFRRRIAIAALGGPSAGEVRLALEDDFHHFRVAVHHRDRVVTAAAGTALRTPYVTCPDAAGGLSVLVGATVDRAGASLRAADSTGQCTHLVDLAGLGCSAAAAGVRHRRYDAAIPRRVDGATRATLHRDGSPLLIWDMTGDLIRGPLPFVGISVRDGFAKWAAATLGPDTLEAALVLRRCAIISMGRTKNLDAQESAAATGRCYAQAAGRARASRRVIGSTLDFTERPDELCAADTPWLAGGEA